MKDTSNHNAFTQAGKNNAANRSFLSEMLGFLSSNKRWWLTPIIIVVLLLGALVMLSGTGLAPFIYTLF